MTLIIVVSNKNYKSNKFKADKIKELNINYFKNIK